MDQFEDTEVVVGRGSSNINDDGGGETKWEGENDCAISRKKRPPSNMHPETYNSSKKRSSENNNGGNDESNNCEQERTHNTSHEILSSNKPEEEPDDMDEEKSTESNEFNTIDHWEEFVDFVDDKSIPNLDAYVKAKEIRTEASIRFVNSMNECIQTLRDTTEGILSEVVEPVCNRYSEGFNDDEDSIIETMVSNHSRRKELLELLRSADDAWANKFNTLMAEITADNRVDQKCATDFDILEDGNEKGKGPNESSLSSQHLSKSTVSAVSLAENKDERTIFGHKDSDWEELLEYEPSRERILSFLDERVKRNHIMKAFEESLDEIHSGLQNEAENILQIASDLFNQREGVFFESEDEIEYLVMENYERRVNLKKELEQSALQAQGLFANLLSRLSQSAS